MKVNQIPVLAPDGTAALNRPKSVIKSTSTVGLPLESKILLANTLFMLRLVLLKFLWQAMPNGMDKNLKLFEIGMTLTVILTTDEF